MGITSNAQPWNFFDKQEGNSHLWVLKKVQQYFLASAQLQCISVARVPNYRRI